MLKLFSKELYFALMEVEDAAPESVFESLGFSC